MKRLVVCLAMLAAGVLVFDSPAYAEDPPLSEDLYLSEISISTSLDEKYVEIFINNPVTSNDYYIMTTSNDGSSLSTGYNLAGISDQEAGSHYVFTGVKAGLYLTNPSNGRILYLCQGDQSKTVDKEACKTDYVDKYAYSYLLNTSNSWSRDFDDENLIFKESIKTPGQKNNFAVGEDEDEDEDKEEDIEKVTQYCQALVLSEISSVEQWVEIYNKSDLTIFPANMSECLLGVQSGDTKAGGLRNYSYYKVSSFLSFSSINRYAYVVLDLTKTESKNKIIPNSSSIKDRSVIIADDETDYDYGAIYKSQKEGTTLSYFADGWKVTYSPTPGEENKYQQYQTCEPGKHINEKTGNCVKDPEPPAECAEGQYRNPETGRCKKIAEANVLAECPEGQYRNPLTNRCKKIATDDDLVPCAEGYERNPETNRCRKIRASENAEYAVEPFGVSNENHTWAIIGAIGIGAIGLLIILQFRHEIAQGFGNIVRRIKK